MGELRYADAGVDIDAGNRAVGLMQKALASTRTGGVVGAPGGFAGLFSLENGGWKQPLLVSSTDSVGTKVKIGIATSRHRGLGIDLVNHCVNDILCCGAQPLFFLDYIASGKTVPEVAAELVEGMAEACRAAACALIGGETAELPGLYAMGDYDVAGFIVGAVERDQIIDGREIRRGDRVLALPSNGLHTNGYSLARRVVLEHEMDWDARLPGTDEPLADILLRPHLSYLQSIRALQAEVTVLGLAHITGGGLLENIPRILPPDLGVVLQRSAWEVPPIFPALQAVGGIEAGEMWRTFNMGLGMIVIVRDHPGLNAAAGIPLLEVGEVVHSTGPERVKLL